MTPETLKVKHPSRRRGGPTPYVRLPFETKLAQGLDVWARVAAGASIRKAAADLGMSPTTAWRRVWFARDWALPTHYGRPAGPIPPQRGTAACPNGWPHLPTFDGPRPARNRVRPAAAADREG